MMLFTIDAAKKITNTICGRQNKLVMSMCIS